MMVECANYLAERGHEAHVYACEWDADVLKPQVSRHPVSCGAHPAALRPLRFRRGCGSRIAEARGSYDVLSTFGVECPAGGVFWVGSVHRRWLEISGRQRDWKGRLRQRANLFHPVILGLERQCFAGRRYRKLIALTDEVKADLVHFYHVPDADVAVVPNGFSPTEFNVARAQDLREEMRGELGYSAEERVVVFVANELERKGFEPLLRGMAFLQDPALRLLVVGRVSSGACAAEIQRLGMEKAVRFTGPSADVGRYYAAADFFALPTYYEAWGLVIVEAMACGLPVLTSRLAGAAVAVQPGRTGELLDNPRDAEEVGARLADLLKIRVAPEEVSASVQAYTWPSVLSRYERILKECAD